MRVPPITPCFFLRQIPLVWVNLFRQAAIFLRKPDALHTPQLWAEDGSIFLMQADMHGLESFTIDGEFLLGPAPDAMNPWLACGFCAHGISSAGGVGKALAEWIVHGNPGLDLSEMSLSRFGGR